MTILKPVNFQESIVIIDWNTNGHHLTYLKEFILAFNENNIRIVVLSPECPIFDPPLSSVVWRQIPTIEWIKNHHILGSFTGRWRFARRIKSITKETERILGTCCKKVFFGCFYENEAKIASQVITALALPASGLYLQADLFYSKQYLTNCKLRYKVERLFRHPLLSTIFMLDNEMIPTVKSWCQKTVTRLPDISDYSIEKHDTLAQELKLVPKMRPVLGLLGHLRPSKGVVEMIAFARSVPDLDITFLLAGFCRWSEFDPNEVEFIRKAIAEDARIVFHSERIPNESSYNSLVLACDVLWAVYRNSPHSSNTLAKAAFFEKPVIVADGYMMGSATRKYALGAVVDETDSANLRDTLCSMLTDTSGWLAAHPPLWEEFCKDHSKEYFRERLREWAHVSL